MNGWRPPPCGPCSFVVPIGQPESYLTMQVKNFKRASRVGNYVYATFKAFLLAYYCGAYVELPDYDDVLRAFDIQPDFRAFLFPRPGAVALRCSNKSGDAGSFFHTHLPRNTIPEEIEDELLSCFRSYLGVCDVKFCEGYEALRGNKLVAHVRNGDIFKRNFQKNVHKLYWQPPLSYYMAAINSSRAQHTVFVGEPTSDTSPVWLQMERLQSFNMFRTRITFQSKSIKDDLRTMMCARNFVESRSTLGVVTRLGFVENFFSYHCFTPILHSTTVHVSHFEHPKVHDNQPIEWIYMLTGLADPFKQCEIRPQRGKIDSILEVLCYFHGKYCPEAS